MTYNQTQSHNSEEEEKKSNGYDGARLDPTTTAPSYDERGVNVLKDNHGAEAQHVDVDEGYDPEFIRKTVRKIDWRLVPFLAACYSISLIDRTNISLAREAGMGVDLQLTGNRYSIAVLMFFVPYIILEMPSQLGLRKFGAAIWLSTAVFLWGVVMIGMGFVKNHQQLTACRALVGIFEAALFPGATYLISCWYVRNSTQKRLSFFYVMSVLATGLSAILAYGLSLISTINSSLRPWQWIFVVEGLLTVVLGLLGYWIIVDFPDKAKFLTEEQREMILTRIDRDRADAVMDKFTWKKMGKYAMELKLWAFALMFMGTTTASYALSYFLPRILAGMGFDLAMRQILVFPPYAYALIPAIGSAVMSDKTRIRSIWIIINALCAILGLALFSNLPTANTAGRYAGIFLCAGGCNANVPLIIGWSQISIRAQTKRAYTSALTVAFGGVGGIISALVFKNNEAPRYPTGIWFTIACQIFIILCCCVLSFDFARRNKRADRTGEMLEGHRDFRYQL